MQKLNNPYSLLVLIVNHGSTPKVIKYAKSLGCSGGTIILGEGAVNNAVLDFLELNSTRKEIILFLVPTNRASLYLEKIDDKYKFERANNGISFVIPVKEAVGMRLSDKEREALEKLGESKGQDDFEKSSGGKEMNSLYDVIFTIVDRGNSDDVLDAANEAGATGGTILHGRGTTHAVEKTLFNLNIEPEKEIVMIIAEAESAKDISKAITEKMNLEDPGRGILFTVPATMVKGLRK